MFVYACPMTVRLALAADMPASVFARLRGEVERQGAPAMTVRREAADLVFEGETSEFMLRCRALTALESIYDHDEWQRVVRL